MDRHPLGVAGSEERIDTYVAVVERHQQNSAEGIQPKD